MSRGSWSPQPAFALRRFPYFSGAPERVGSALDTQTLHARLFATASRVASSTRGGGHDGRDALSAEGSGVAGDRVPAHGGSERGAPARRDGAARPPLSRRWTIG